MADTALVLVIGKDPVIARLAPRLGLEGMEARSISSPQQLEGALAAIARRAVAVIDGSLPEDAYSGYSELLHKRYSVPSLVITPREQIARFVASVASLDAAAVVDYAPGPADLEELVLRTKATILRAGFDVPEPAAEGRRPAAGEPGAIRSGKVVGVFSAKGGVGKSTIAVNVAIGLAKFYGHRTLLVDANLWFGDAGFLLNVDSRRSLFDLCSGTEPDIVSLRQVAVEHESGIAVIQKPTDLRQAEKIAPVAIAKVLTVASAAFDFVVVDMQSTLDETTLQVLDTVDQILLVTTPEVSSIANTAQFLGIADELGYRPKVSLVVNRANSGINLGAVERTLGMEAAGTIISAGLQVLQAANEGTSIFSKFSEECQVARDLGGVVEKIAGQPRTRREEKAAAQGASPVGMGRLNLMPKWSW